MNDLNSHQEINISLAHSLKLISESKLENDTVIRHLLSIIQKCFSADIVLHLERTHDNQSWKAKDKYPQRTQIEISSYTSELLETCQLAHQTNKKQTKRISDTLTLHVLPLDHRSSSETLNVLAWVEIDNLASVITPAQRTMMEFAVCDLAGKPKKSLGLGSGFGADEASARINDNTLVSMIYELCSIDKFLEASFFLCNSLAFHMASTRVSLGIFDKKKITLKAVSQSANFDRRSALAQDLINAMEEAADQDLIITYPSKDMDSYIHRQHRIFSENYGSVGIVSIPVGGIQSSFGVLTLEFKNNLPSDDELKKIEFFITAIGPVLERNLNSSRLLVTQIFRALINGARWMLGPRKIATKLLAVASFIFFWALFVVEANHRIDTKATIRAEHTVVIPAPFDGFLSKVHVELGAYVHKNDDLVEMDTRELIQEERVALAENARYQTEIEKALATGKLAEMQIARAQLAQAQAKLDLVRFRIATSQIRAPRNGIVVEGDLMQTLGSPVKRGEMLLRLADTDQLYLELEINQSDIHLLKEHPSGELLLAGRPDERIPFTLTNIDPIAQVKDSSNIFLARAVFETDKQSWWRPGMGGTAKIETGPRTLIWSLTYRTINFIRELLWI